MTIYKAIIPGRPITKKNHQSIVQVRGRPIVMPSKQYKKYAAECKEHLPVPVKPIDVRCNVKTVYYMPTRHIVDLPNLQEATLDILVQYGILADDNSRIVSTMDGSQVLYDKENPRVEITIDMLGDNDGE